MLRAAHLVKESITMNKDKIEETVKNEAEVENKMEAAPNGTAAKKKRLEQT